jgi:two-component system, LuxR family, sensor kinase FixL
MGANENSSSGSASSPGSIGSRILAALARYEAWPRSARLGAVVALVALAVGLRIIFLGLFAVRPIYLTLYPAVAIAALIGGLAGGVLATFLSAVAAHLLVTPLRAGADWLALATFLVSCAIIIGASVLLRHAQTQAAKAELERQNEARLRNFVEQASGAMAMLDRDERYVASSARWRDEYHLAGDLVGRRHYEVFPDIPARWKEVLRRALAGETVSAETDSFDRADGSTYWLRWEVRPWRRPDGGIGGIIIFTENITECVAAQEALRALVDNLPDSAVYRYTVDKDGSPRFLYFSAGIEKLNGVTVAEVLADAGVLHRQVLPDYLPKLLDAEQVSLRQGSDLAMDAPMRRPDGEIRWMRLRSHPVREPDGRIIWHGVQTDITEQKRAEEALRGQERRLKATVDAALEGIITIDENGVIQSANPAALEMYGYQADEMVGHNVRMLMPDPYRREHDGYIAHYLRGGEKRIIGSRRVVEGLRKNGEIFPKELAVTEARIDDRILFVGFMRDLSAIEVEKRRADALRDELARVSRMNDLGEVVAGLAHEISQPIAAIALFVGAARRMALPADTPRLAEVIDQVEAQSGRANDILRRLREFIQKRDSEYREENLRELIQESVGFAFPDSSARRARLSFKLAQDEVFVAVDRVQIEQVLVNFLRNAADATANEAQPEIGIEMSLTEPGFVRVSVSDNGPGVDEKIVDQLFNPFVTTKKFGMGVGLSLCKTLVEKHNGRIGYSPNHPRGAVFWFALPVLGADDIVDDDLGIDAAEAVSAPVK